MKTPMVSFVAALAWATLPPTAAAWPPSKALVSQLAPAAVAGAYQIQPPKGDTRENQAGPDGSAIAAWAGPPRADGTRPYVMLLMMSPPAGEGNKYTLVQVAAKLLAGVQRRRKDWKQTPPETGTVNGLTFVCTRWSGKDAVTGRAMQGFSDVAHDGKSFIQLSSRDADPHSKTSLPLAEASALTFKKHRAEP